MVVFLKNIPLVARFGLSASADESYDVLPYDKRKLGSKGQVLGRGEGHSTIFLDLGIFY